MRIAISQSMYFPWKGFLELLSSVDTFVVYDDVQFSKGSYTNRVQIKSPNGKQSWLTIPMQGLKFGQKINEIFLKNITAWSTRHLQQLEQAYKSTKYFPEMMEVVKSVLTNDSTNLSDISHKSTIALLEYFGLNDKLNILNACDLGIKGESSQRVFDIVNKLGGTAYITGHGASKYLDHHLFDSHNIEVRYVDYTLESYPQQHGSFIPYVSALDLVSNCGKNGKRFIQPQSIYWKNFKYET